MYSIVCDVIDVLKNPRKVWPIMNRKTVGLELELWYCIQFKGKLMRMKTFFHLGGQIISRCSTPDVSRTWPFRSEEKSTKKQADGWMDRWMFSLEKVV